MGIVYGRRKCTKLRLQLQGTAVALCDVLWTWRMMRSPRTVLSLFSPEKLSLSLLRQERERGARMHRAGAVSTGGVAQSCRLVALLLVVLGGRRELLLKVLPQVGEELGAEAAQEEALHAVLGDDGRDRRHVRERNLGRLLLRLDDADRVGDDVRDGRRAEPDEGSAYHGQHHLALAH